jgi:septal ring-binding cell division protein DamX
MAGRSRGGDIVLGGRHLVGVFALLVVVLGMVFTLGYLLGRSRYEEPAKAIAANATSEVAPTEARTTTPTAPSEAPGVVDRSDAPASWDFYRAGEPAKAPALVPVPSAETKTSTNAATAPAQPPSAPAPRVPATRQTPPMSQDSALIPKGAITLQVAALENQADALALAQALQDKEFPAIVTTPSMDKYYRVQVGPYPNMQAATAVRRDLEKEGFKPFVRR